MTRFGESFDSLEESLSALDGALIFQPLTFWMRCTRAVPSGSPLKTSSLEKAA